MRILIGSLMMVVLMAIVGVGWTLDQLFDRVTDDTITDEVQIYQEMGAQIAAILNSPKDARTSLAADTGASSVSLSLHESDNFQPPPSMLAEFHTGKALVLDSDEGVSLHYYLPDSKEVLTVIPERHNAVSRSAVRLIFTTLFYTFVLMLFMLWLYPLIRRLNRLGNAAREFGKGRLESRVSTQGVSYIADIERVFNGMAERIQTLISDNKLLSSAVSHDLRTPLARLRFGIDTLADTHDQSARDRYTARLSDDISEMEQLVGSLLEYARLDHETPENHQKVVSISNLVTQCIERYTTSNITIVVHMADDLLLEGNESQLRLLVANLLQNAHKYAEHAICVELKTVVNGMSLRVSDDGPGIPVSQHRSVLLPFIHGTTDNPEKAHGLGLAIVNRVAQRHGGLISIDRCEKLGGARISVFFPCLDESDKSR